MIDIDCIDQSAEIDDTLVSFIDLSRFYRFHRFHLLLIQKWNRFHANSEFLDNWVAIESQRIKQFIITFKKNCLKKHIFSLKPGLKTSSGGRYILARIVGAQFFTIYICLPFKITSVPRVVTSQSSQQIKSLAIKWFLSIDNGKRWKSI